MCRLVGLGSRDVGSVGAAVGELVGISEVCLSNNELGQETAGTIIDVLGKHCLVLSNLDLSNIRRKHQLSGEPIQRSRSGAENRAPDPA
mmetsp:Transcript_718/g.1689  ORF Transcript_718/g.1689 Transcript_718/m.1689 type:complete len:89 (+) Transcript_718:1021-1287(+)